MSTAPDSDNPYVGPRPFRKGELLRGRDREARGLTDKLLGERIVLLHSPSGAGKTSLIQASLVPRMEKAGFQVCARHLPTFSALRVYAPPPTDFAVKNRYVFSAVMGLLGDLEPDPVRLADLSFGQALDRMSERPGAPKYQLVIFDQLEEALTLNPADRDSQLEFFRQVGEALDDGRRWALLSIREDYMGGLDRFTRYLPTGLRSTYRLDFLERDAAFQAIQGPARERGVDFSDEAASELFDDLRAVRVQGPCHDPVQILGPYVEPVHLQVVCHRLWRVLSERPAEGFHSISAEQITPFRDVAGALGAYYADAVRETAQKTGTDERLIRDWFETQLITARGFRSQTLTGPATNDTTAAAVLGGLERRYLVRGRAGAGRQPRVAAKQPPRVAEAGRRVASQRPRPHTPARGGRAARGQARALQRARGPHPPREGREGLPRALAEGARATQPAPAHQHHPGDARGARRVRGGAHRVSPVGQMTGRR